ncbi:hypothetical protein AAP_04953 [Ascosphaera apis ARSEF 7405]|uniref:Uncharacterized protein n=1 Tax=Ascosphaera apis ARSEF 7405 TaxID=392613 RepID=A0A167W492_9EURO|nr:hypothetical protein AAP_04953 [Ascosphaera apis ARSEF 7405]
MSSSSILDDEEEGIVTMGLQVQHQRRQDQLRRRRKRTTKLSAETGIESLISTTPETTETTISVADTSIAGPASEQGDNDNEDDNEQDTSSNSSDSDHVISSSTEDLASPMARAMMFLSRGNSTANSSASASVISSEIDEYDNDIDDDMDVDDSDDETALGPTNSSYTRVEGFKPQPHVFSHFTSPTTPSESQYQQHRPRPDPSSRLSSQTIRPLGTRPVRSPSGPRLAASIVSPGTSTQHVQQQQQQQPPRSHLTSFYPSTSTGRNQDEHDAALRASLSTLLSCARGLASNDVVPQQTPPSANETAAAVVSAAPTNPVPGKLRLVPESVALARQTEGNERTGRRSETILKDGQARGASATVTTTTTISRQQSPSSTKKRSAPQTVQPPRTSPRQVKRRQLPSPSSSASSSPRRCRTSSDTTTATHAAHNQYISPTLLPYLVGAGALIVVFSAGYALGRRAGRLEPSGIIDFEGGGTTTASAAANMGDADAVRGIGSGCKREGIRGIWDLKLRWLGAGSSDIASA